MHISTSTLKWLNKRIYFPRRPISVLLYAVIVGFAGWLAIPNERDGQLPLRVLVVLQEAEVWRVYSDPKGDAGSFAGHDSLSVEKYKEFAVMHEVSGSDQHDLLDGVTDAIGN